MSRVFRPGDSVKVIAGPRAGEITTVTGPSRKASCRTTSAVHAARNCFCLHGLPEVYPLDLKAMNPLDGTPNSFAPPSWLIPYREDREPSEDFRSAEDILASLRTTVKERIDG